MGDGLTKLNQVASAYAKSRRAYMEQAAKDKKITTEEAQEVSDFGDQADKLPGRVPYSQEYQDKMGLIHEKAVGVGKPKK